MVGLIGTLGPGGERGPVRIDTGQSGTELSLARCGDVDALVVSDQQQCAAVDIGKSHVSP